ncbi:MAG TPA: AEC family transporter [Stellaceae bacterium]|nr:AEC family transporter [Stellaceae bacterium]
MQAVFGAAFPVFALILAGGLAGRFGVLDAPVTGALNRFVISLALPALLFDVTAHAPLRQVLDWGFIAAFGGGMIGTLLLMVPSFRRQSLSIASLRGLNATYCNVGFMGIPLCAMAFGPASLGPVVIAVIMTASLQFAGVVALIEIDRHGGRSEGVGRYVLLRLVRNPLVTVPALGLVMDGLGLEMPVPIGAFIKLLAQAASPCALVATGLFIAAHSTEFRASKVFGLVTLKLLVQPALTWLIADRLLHLPPLLMATAVLLSALPTGTGPFILAEAYDTDQAPAAATILLTTILSVLTVTALLAVLTPL